MPRSQIKSAHLAAAESSGPRAPRESEGGGRSGTRASAKALDPNHDPDSRQEQTGSAHADRKAILNNNGIKSFRFHTLKPLLPPPPLCKKKPHNFPFEWIVEFICILVYSSRGKRV